MKAAILDALGAVPHFGDFAEPSPHDGEQVVKVAAAAIKPLDRAIAAGTHYSSPKALPVICGMDGVGYQKDGSRVYFTTLRRPYGAMAERAPASWTVPVPEGLSDAQAAAIVNPALAAWLPLLWRGRMQAGETVLIMGATGAAGRFAVKAARWLGAGRIIAAGRRLDLLADMDVDAAIDLRLPEDDLRAAFAREAARGVNVIVDYLWGKPVELLLESLAKSDLSIAGAVNPVRLVSVGEMAGSAITLPSALLRASRLEIMGSGTANFPPLGQMKAIVADILARAAAGQFELAVQVHPLADVARIWSTIQDTDVRPVLVP